LASQVPFTFIPRFDSDTVQARIEMPPGTPILEADRVMNHMSAELRTLPEVEGVFASLNGTAGAATSGDLFIQLTPRSERNRSAYALQQVMRPMLSAYPNYRAS